MWKELSCLAAAAALALPAAASEQAALGAGLNVDVTAAASEIADDVEARASAVARAAERIEKLRGLRASVQDDVHASLERIRAELSRARFLRDELDAGLSDEERVELVADLAASFARMDVHLAHLGSLDARVASLVDVEPLRIGAERRAEARARAAERNVPARAEDVVLGRDVRVETGWGTGALKRLNEVEEQLRRVEARASAGSWTRPVDEQVEDARADVLDLALRVDAYDEIDDPKERARARVAIDDELSRLERALGFLEDDFARER